MPKADNYRLVLEYANGIVDGRKIACIETIQMCQRFLRDLKNPAYEFSTRDPEFVVQLIEKTLVHEKGEDMLGRPVRGRPFLLEPWQKFIVYNLLGFKHAGTLLRRFKEAFIMIARKNGKTPFVAALAWALGLLERLSGAEIVVVGNLLKQAIESFDFLFYNIKAMGEAGNFRILNNNQEHSISGELGKGFLRIETIAGNSDRMDGLNTLIQILDELHLYRSAKQYNTIRDSGKAYRNSLCIGITTGGDNTNSFCYRRKKYCQKILDGTVEDEQYFVFIAKADADPDTGEVDYTNPKEHEKANPNYGVSVRAQELMNAALQAQNDPQQRKDFLAKSLNIYTSAMKAYFNLDEFKASDRKYTWTLDELAKLPVEWYGGADLAKLHDLCGTALYGTYEDVDIAITHGFFPVVTAHLKADEDNIPLFGWQDDGWLTMTNSPVTDHQEIVKWFVAMRNMGFKIKQVGFDRKFGREFFLEMQRQRFRIEDTPQLYHLKSEGFRRIESKAKAGNFCYLHSTAYEYCLSNVRAIEQVDDAVKYEKIMPENRIDLFDASVFACMQMLKNLAKSSSAEKWLKGGERK